MVSFPDGKYENFPKKGRRCFYDKNVSIKKFNDLFFNIHSYRYYLKLGNLNIRICFRYLSKYLIVSIDYSTANIGKKVLNFVSQNCKETIRIFSSKEYFTNLLL